MALPTRVNRGQTDPFEQFEGMMNRFLGGREADGNMGLAPYAVDVREDADHIYVEAELPGFKKDEIDITLENQTLTIAAERKSETHQGEPGKKKGDVLLNERRYTRFLRSFTLPPTVNEQSCDAKLNDGVLTITLTKREESKPRKVQVN